MSCDTEPQTAAPDADWQTQYQYFSTQEHKPAATTDLVKLQHWPDLGIVPDAQIGTVARICALLWMKPTAGRLIAPILGEDPVHTHLLLQVLHARGHVEFANYGDRLGAMANEDAAAFPQTEKAGERMSFIHRLRQQLLGKQQ